MSNGGLGLILVVVPMVVADRWGRWAMYKTVGGAFVLILPFILDTKGGLDRGNFSLIKERQGRKLNVGKDTEFVTVEGVE